MYDTLKGYAGVEYSVRLQRVLRWMSTLGQAITSRLPLRLDYSEGYSVPYAGGARWREHSVWLQGIIH